MTSNPASQPESAGVARRLVAIAAAGLVLLAVGAVVQRGLYWFAHRPSANREPPERQGLNAPFVTTPDPVIEEMIALAELTENDLVYDLGCGDGRIVIAASLKSGCRGVGFDIDPQRVVEARDNAAKHGVADRVTFQERDVFTVDLGQADVAMLYLLPWMIEKLIPQFDAMQPGARIVTHDYWIEGVEPERVSHVQVDKYSSAHDVYFYTTPLKKNPGLERGTPPRPPD